MVTDYLSIFQGCKVFPSFYRDVHLLSLSGNHLVSVICAFLLGRNTLNKQRRSIRVIPVNFCENINSLLLYNNQLFIKNWHPS